MDHRVRACLIVFVVLLVGNQVLKAQPIAKYDEQDDMTLYGTDSSVDVEETTQIDFDRWTPEPLNSTDIYSPQPLPVDQGVINKMIKKIRGWTNSSFNKVRSWGQAAKTKFCSYECFTQYSRVAKFCSKPSGIQAAEQDEDDVKQWK